MLTVLIPNIVFAIFLKTNPPLTEVSVTGSVHVKFSSKTKAPSDFCPLSILNPAVPKVTPFPVSPKLTVIILSCTSRLVELTIVCDPPTVMLPVKITSPCN